MKTSLIPSELKCPQPLCKGCPVIYNFITPEQQEMQCQIFCELAAKKILIIDDGAMELTFPSIPVIIVPTYIKLILFCEGKHALDKNWKEWVAFLRSLIKNRFKMSLSKLEFRAR